MHREHGEKHDKPKRRDSRTYPFGFTNALVAQRKRKIWVSLKEGMVFCSLVYLPEWWMIGTLLSTKTNNRGSLAYPFTVSKVTGDVDKGGMLDRHYTLNSLRAKSRRKSPNKVFGEVRLQ